MYGTFRTIGYAPSIAHVLTGLCTNVVPQTVWQVVSDTAGADARRDGSRFWLGRQLATPHLPQGAPTSPALANLAAFGLDRRLSGLARSLELSYSRYADDLTFSGSTRLRRGRRGIEGLVAEIARDEGFVVNADKTALRTRGSRQTVCGIVVNDRPNVPRVEYDRLRALLHNAARDGPEVHNRGGVPDFEAHVRGRIAWMSAVNPVRGEKLRRMFELVDWGAEDGQRRSYDRVVLRTAPAANRRRRARVHPARGSPPPRDRLRPPAPRRRRSRGAAVARGAA